jgi:hypothetical protein
MAVLKMGTAILVSSANKLIYFRQMSIYYGLSVHRYNHTEFETYVYVGF